MPDQEKSAATAITRSGVTRPRERFGAGRIIGETFVLLFRRLHILVGFGLAPAVLASLVLTSYTGRFGFGVLEILVRDVLLPGVICLVSSSVTIAFSGLLVSNVKTGRQTAFRPMLAQIARSVLPLTISVFLLLVMIYLAFALITMPVYMSGILTPTESLLIFVPVYFAIFYLVMTVYSAMTPAIVLERRWFAMTRSRHLTKHYRWPCFTVVFTASMACFLIAICAELILSTRLGWSPALAHHLAPIAMLLLLPAIFGISGTLIYLRLRELKDGVLSDRFIEVFE